MLSRLKADKDSLPTVAVVDSQSVKNSATATQRVGFDGGKLIKGRKRVIAVDTMGHVLWNTVQAANLHDGKAGVLLWEQAQAFNPLAAEVGLVYADGTFGGHFKEELERVHDLEVVITSAPVEHQPTDGKLIIHKWRWIVERTIAWLGNNRRLARDYERTTLSAQTFIWIAHIRRTLKRLWQ